MTLTTRLQRLQTALARWPPPGQLDLVVCLPAGSDMTAGEPLGVSLAAGGSVATYVYAGAAPDPAVLGPLEARKAPCALTIVSHGPDAA